MFLGNLKVPGSPLSLLILSGQTGSHLVQVGLQVQGLLGDLVFHLLLVGQDSVQGTLVLLRSLWVPSPLEGLSLNLHLRRMGLEDPRFQALPVRLGFLAPHEHLGILGHLGHLLPGMDGASRQRVLGVLVPPVLPWVLEVHWGLAGCTVKQRNAHYKRGFLLLPLRGGTAAPLLCVNQDFIRVKL